MSWWWLARTCFILYFWGSQLNEEEQGKIKTHNLLSLLEGEKKLVKCALPIDRDFILCLGAETERYGCSLLRTLGRELKMQEASSSALAKYDYIIIDTSPSQEA